MRSFYFPPLAVFEQVLVLSTAHVTKDEMEAVVQWAEKNPDGAWNREPGVMLHIHCTNNEALPTRVRELLAWVAEGGGHWLMLDCDGQILSFLETFDW